MILILIKIYTNIRFRLLDVDNNLFLSINIQIRLLVRSVDVIPSFTVPSLGFKVDAVPGRINQVNLKINRPDSLPSDWYHDKVLLLATPKKDGWGGLADGPRFMEVVVSG